MSQLAALHRGLWSYGRTVGGGASLGEALALGALGAASSNNSGDGSGLGTSQHRGSGGGGALYKLN
jgi:hypothetical protein